MSTAVRAARPEVDVNLRPHDHVIVLFGATGDLSRRPDQPAGVEHQPGRDGEREREDEADRADPEEPPPEAVDVYLEPGEEEQEGQADEGHDLDRLVDLDPAEA